MSNYILHKAATRGNVDLGWLKSYHSFSFSHYHNPERMNFGLLRVLNDDQVAPGMGFSTHPHQNMEIISIPLFGDLEHKDSMGNTAIIKNGDVQVMSAGSGISHSEKNKNKDKEVRFLQIWIIPKTQNVSPRYQQISLDVQDRHNQFHLIVAPQATEKGVWIHQDAWFHLSDFDANHQKKYTFKNANNGLYIFNLEGEIQVDNQILQSRDGLGITETKEVQIQAKTNASFLLIEVPPLN